jgi:hypothetical protein
VISRFLFAAALALPLVHARTERIPLAGSWNFRLDPENLGHAQQWFAHPLGEDIIFLPGDTDQAGYGTKVIHPDTGWLTRPYKYTGAAWYQRDVVIPPTWRGDHITLFLERPHWQTEVWVDGKAFGVENSLTTPHVYDLSDPLTPGRHTITICVDNTYRIDVGTRAHSVTEHTQTNWNGIVGVIELRAAPPVWIESVALYPDIHAKTLRAVVEMGNRTGAPASAAIIGGNVVSRFTIAGTHFEVELAISLPNARLWDEYDPSLYPVEFLLSAGGRTDRVTTIAGLREIATRGTQFLLNGRPIFLRGNLECAIFPLTGYASMRVEDWERLFRIARSYGLNAFRFHSWCPPETAFVAADRAGFLLHVELPVWSNKVGKDPKLDDFMRAEGYRMLKTYGNHPSFTMLCLGNELVGDDTFMDTLVAEFKKADPRRLYTFSADHRRRMPGPTSDYYVTQQTSAGRLRINGTRFGKIEGGTDHDFSVSVAAVHVPLVAHELGQWAVFPSYDEIAEYTGVLKPRNLEPFRAELEQRGMLDLAEDFQQASGKFSWAVYKEDMEAALRTPGLGGFFLLQLQDFPGQGEALVGLLDSFWDSKGLLTPEQFRRFCNQTVPLLRMKKFVWTNDETFTAHAEVAHYGKEPIGAANAAWSIADDQAREIAHGNFPAVDGAVGSVTPLGDISFPLTSVDHAAHLTVSVHVADFHNDWSIWVYPAHAAAETGKVLVSHAFDDATRRALADGGTVLLTVPRDQKGAGLVPTRFLPVFWSNAFFTDQPATMGIYCDPRHPSLADFPTSAHSDWQWWQLTQDSHAFVLDDTPAAFRPIVYQIDDFHRNHKLGVVIEARVGNGKLLATSFDLSDPRPVPRQLLHSLLEYAAGPQFHPSEELPMAELEKLFAAQ